MSELTTELPDGWTRCISKSTGKTYYYNQLTGASSWRHPSKLSKSSRKSHASPKKKLSSRKISKLSNSSESNYKLCSSSKPNNDEEKSAKKSSASSQVEKGLSSPTPSNKTIKSEILSDITSPSGLQQDLKPITMKRSKSACESVESLNLSSTSVLSERDLKMFNEFKDNQTLLRHSRVVDVANWAQDVDQVRLRASNERATRGDVKDYKLDILTKDITTDGKKYSRRKRQAYADMEGKSELNLDSGETSLKFVKQRLSDPLNVPTSAMIDVMKKKSQKARTSSIGTVFALDSDKSTNSGIKSTYNKIAKHKIKSHVGKGHYVPLSEVPSGTSRKDRKKIFLQALSARHSSTETNPLKDGKKKGKNKYVPLSELPKSRKTPGNFDAMEPFQQKPKASKNRISLGFTSPSNIVNPSSTSQSTTEFKKIPKISRIQHERSSSESNTKFRRASVSSESSNPFKEGVLTPEMFDRIASKNTDCSMQIDPSQSPIETTNQQIFNETKNVSLLQKQSLLAAATLDTSFTKPCVDASALPMNDSDIEMEDAVEMSKEILKEIRGMREENIVSKPTVHAVCQAGQEIAIYEDPLHIVVDTNILLGHLKFVSELKDFPVPGIGPPILIIPWMVIQELDSLKDAVNRVHQANDGDEDKTTNLSVLARQAIKFINSCLQSEHPRVKGETVIEASTSITGFSEENNDDSIIHCALGLKQRALHSQIVLLSNDRNLCNKAMISGVKSFCQKSLIPGLRSLFQSGTVVVRRENYQEYYDEYKVQQAIAQRRKQADTMSCELQCILREGLSKVIEKEMKEAYDEDLWLQIVKIQPPWTLHDVFVLLERHWIAVFGQVVERHLNKTVTELKILFQANEGCAGNLDVVKQMLELSWKLFESFSVRSNYDEMMEKCLSAVRVLVNNCADYIKEALKDPQLEYNPPQALPAPETVEQQEAAPPFAKIDQHANVLEAFDVIWRTVTRFSALIFASIGYPSPLVSELDPNEARPSKEESYDCLNRLIPCLALLVKGIQNVLGIPQDQLQSGADVLSKLQDAIKQFAVQILSREFNVSILELMHFIQDPKTRMALVQGLSQLDRSYATLQMCRVKMSSQT